MTDEITRWIGEKVKSLSYEEIIEEYRTWSSARRQSKFARVKLTVKDGPEPHRLPIIRVSLAQDDGRWTERSYKLGWGMKRPHAEPFFACVAVSNLRYKGWVSSPIERIGFLRVGIGGAMFISPNGDRTMIQAPPFDRPPAYMESFFTADRTGRLVIASRAHPDREAWDRWEMDVAALCETLRQRAEVRGRIVDVPSIAWRKTSVCSACERHAALDKDNQSVWRVARGQLYCASCAMREL